MADIVFDPQAEQARIAAALEGSRAEQQALDDQLAQLGQERAVLAAEQERRRLEGILCPACGSRFVPGQVL